MANERRTRQLKFFPSAERAYGGELLKTRRGRSAGRPISVKESMHLVMKSKLAQGKWSLRTPRNLKLVDALLAKHSRRWGLRVLSRANVGNHLHLQVRVPSRRAYVNFIRAFSAAVAMGVTGFSRWERPEKGFKFWDHRPFTRIVSAGFRPLRILRDYLRVNQLEGQGWSRDLARMIVREELPLLI